VLSSETLSAAVRAISPAIINDRITAGPAIDDAIPGSIKIPAPTIAPELMEIIDSNPKSRLRISFTIGFYLNR
jgi:hypothetical protein